MRPLAGRYFKIHPVTWRSWISMRVELYGCVNGMLICNQTTKKDRTGVHERPVKSIIILPAASRISIKPL